MKSEPNEDGHHELVRIAQTIADADKARLDLYAKKDQLIQLKVRAREMN